MDKLEQLKQQITMIMVIQINIDNHNNDNTDIDKSMLIIIPVSDIYWDDGKRAGMKNEIRVRSGWSMYPSNKR